MIDYLVFYHMADDTRGFSQKVRAYTVDHAKGIMNDRHWDDPIIIDKVEVYYAINSLLSHRTA